MAMIWSLLALLLIFVVSFRFLFRPIVDCLPEFLQNRHRMLEWMTEDLAKLPTQTVTFHRPGRVRGVVTANPKNVEYVLKTHFENFPKGHYFISTLEDFLGQGIVNSDGHLWNVQRKTASFEFNTKSLRNFVADTVRLEIQHRLLPLLQRAATTGETIDLQDVMERFAFDNVCKVAFGADPACLGGGGGGDVVGSDPGSSYLPPDFARAFNDATNLSAGRFRYAVPFLWRINRLLSISSERRLRESVDTVHEFAAGIIRARKKDESANAKQDLLSRFMASGDNSEEFLRDIIVSFILAGRDTTSTTLAWFFWLLASSPDEDQKIVDELKSIRSRSGYSEEIFGFEELKEMHYLHAAISEALRLYPPVAVDTKECLKDDVLPDGTFIGKGWLLAYNAYAMGRMESNWGKDCRSFRPERWLDEDGCYRPESPFKYPVFHAGPRMCLGKDMAFIQMKSILACVLERFAIDVPGKGSCPKHVLSLTLRMKDGLPARVSVRSCDSGGFGFCQMWMVCI